MHLGAVAYFSIVHFAACAVVGALVTWLVHEVELHTRRREEPLVVDLLDGQPLFTPSLMGSVLFLGVAAEDVTGVTLGAVAYFSLAHIAAFAALGAAVSLVVHEVELHSRHPIEVLLVLFAIIEVAFFAMAPVVMPGVIASLGIVQVGIANLLAAGSMALFFVLSHREEAWETLRGRERSS